MSEDLAFRKRLARQLLSAGAGPGDHADASRELGGGSRSRHPVPAGSGPGTAGDRPRARPRCPAAGGGRGGRHLDGGRDDGAGARADARRQSRDRWYRLRPRLRAVPAQDPQGRPGAGGRPARASYCPTRIGWRSVLCVKSELHLNQDGVAAGAAKATMPVAPVHRADDPGGRPRLVITVGTAGGGFAKPSSAT